MKLPAWLIIVSHILRGFTIAFLTAIVAGPLENKLTWIAAIGGGIVGGVNALDALNTDKDKGSITSIQIKRPEILP